MYAKCECCGRHRRMERAAKVRSALSNFVLCGPCSNAMHLSKNIVCGLRDYIIDWDDLMKECKNMSKAGLI